MKKKRSRTSEELPKRKLPETVLDIIEKVGNGLLLNILFLLCSIPVITFGASAASYYYAMRNCVVDDNSYPAKTFFKTFGRCFKRSIPYTLIIAALTVLFFVNRQYCAVTYQARKAVIMVAAYDVFIFLLALYTIYIFPAVSRFEGNLKLLSRIVLTAVAKKPLVALALAAVTALGGFLVIKLSVGFTLIVPAVLCYVSVMLLERAFDFR